ncbi:hypothetical protein [Streptomyces sp. NPDC002785]
MTCTDGTVKQPAHDAGAGRPVATVTNPDGAEMPDRELMRDGRWSV